MGPLRQAKNGIKQMRGAVEGTAWAAIFSISALCFTPALSAGQEMLPETQAVFGKYSDRVVKIQVVGKDSGAKAVMGSGFFVDPNGQIITNYHVISKLVLYPVRYRAELVETAGETRVLSVIGVDVINDLALVKAEVNDTPFFRIVAKEPQQGTRLYSMGFPAGHRLEHCRGDL